MKKRLIIVFVGPSGAGKGAIEKILFADQSLNLAFSISATTRARREYEQEGVHYYFISKNKFLKDFENGKFLETGHHFDNFYGTYFKEIERIHNLDKIPFLEIDTEGFKIIRKVIHKYPNWELLSFFIAPPNLQELKKRILKRNTESAETLEIRLKKSKFEMQQKNDYDYIIINQNISQAALEVKKEIQKRLKRNNHAIY